MDETNKNKINFINTEINDKNNNEIKIIKGNLKDTYEVQKNYALLSAISHNSFSMNELKILDTYLSRINSQDDSADIVTFTLDEYKDLMELPNLRGIQLKDYVKRLNKLVEVPMEYSYLFEGNHEIVKNGCFVIPLFRLCACGQTEDDRWIVELACSKEAKALFFFDANEIQYIRYALSVIKNMKHITSCLLYMYLLKEGYRGTWEISVRELTRIFKKDNDKSYQGFKYLRRDFLDSAIEEINACSDIECSYKPLTKGGRSVVAVQFTVTRIIKDSLNEREDIKELPYIDDNLPADIMINTICGNTFNGQEVFRIFEALCKKVPDDTNNVKRQDKLRDAYNKLLEEERKGTKIQNRTTYLISIIENMRDTIKSVNGHGDFTPEFEKFWKVYPRKANKMSAYNEWKKRIHETETPDNLIQAAKVYADDCRDNEIDKTYIKLPQNFLIDGFYLSYLEDDEND